MPALPPRTTMSNPYPAPTDAAGRAWFLGLWDSVAGLLGSAATPASARDGLLLPKRAAKNLLVNPNFSINQRGAGSGYFSGSGDYVRDQWINGGSATVTATGDTGRLTAIDAAGYLYQNKRLTAGVMYTVSNTGTAKFRVKRADDSNIYLFITGPQTFVATSSTIPYEFSVSDGTLGTVLLEEGAFATEAEKLSDLDDLRICQQTYVIMPLSARFPSSAAGQYSDVSFRFPVDMIGQPVPTYLSGQLNSPSLLLRSISSVSKYGGRFSIKSNAAGDCYSVDGLWSFAV